MLALKKSTKNSKQKEKSTAIKEKRNYSSVSFTTSNTLALVKLNLVITMKRAILKIMKLKYKNMTHMPISAVNKCIY